MNHRLLLMALPPLLTACGGIVIVEEGGPAPWDGADGEAAPLPGNGSSPGNPSGSPAASTDWAGWWIRFPTYSAVPSDITALGEDAILVGSGTAGELDLGTGLLAPDSPSGDKVWFVTRVSSEGRVLWIRSAQDEPFGKVAVDTSGRIHVTTARGLRTYDAGGELLQSRSFGDTAFTSVDEIAPTSDGGLLLGIQVDGGEVDLGGGPVPIAGPLPVGLLARLDASGQPVWWREVTAASGFRGVGEDGAGHVIAVTTGAGHVSWGGFELGPGDEFAVVLDAGGDVLSGTVVKGDGATSRAVPSKEPGMLVAGGFSGPLAVNGMDVPYGDPGPNEEKGVVLRLDGEGALASFVVLGWGPHNIAAGPERLVVASSVDSDPIGLVWCADGVEPCDRYSLPETDAYGDRGAVTASGGAAYMTGQGRLTPGGSLTNQWQLYLMKLSR